MSIIKLDESNFQGTVDSGLTLVDFWAEWCGPCRMLAPVLEKVAATPDLGARVGKVNVDENQALASRFNIRGIPTMILFKNGQPVDQLVGMTGEQNILDLISRNK
ncbi:MAG: thioredoxin [bacterium]|jgi:thioredoxin 1|nr:thioredoxin [bacterium]